MQCLAKRHPWQESSTRCRRQHSGLTSQALRQAVSVKIKSATQCAYHWDRRGHRSVHVVGKGRLELPRFAAHDPKSCSSTYFDTSPRSKGYTYLEIARGRTASRISIIS